MEFRKELDDLVTVFELQETALADSRAYVATLERKLAEAGVTPTPEPPPPLKRFATYKEIVWERWPKADLWRFPELAMQVSMNLFPPARMASGDYMPVRNVIVEAYGNLSNVEMRRISGVQPDYELILMRRCVDVTATYKAGIVQNGDDSVEEDRSDWKLLAANYQGKLNQPLSLWRSDFREYALILAAARPDLVLDTERTSGFFDLAPAP